MLFASSGLYKESYSISIENAETLMGILQFDAICLYTKFKQYKPLLIM